MALYLGSERVKLALGSVACCLNVVSVPHTTDRMGLFSLDGFVLKDRKGQYLVPVDAPFVGGSRLLSVDNYMLKDVNNVWLTVEEVK